MSRASRAALEVAEQPQRCSYDILVVGASCPLRRCPDEVECHGCESCCGHCQCQCQSSNLDDAACAKGER